MSSKKNKIILGILSLFLVSTSFAQMGAGYSIFDSAVISAKNKPQHNEFLNNTYNFPAIPRNQWEFGASLGSIAVNGDIPSRVPSLGFEAHLRKAIGYTFSLRLQYTNATAYGMNWTANDNYQRDPAWLSAANGGNLGTKSYNPIVRSAAGAITTLNGGAAQAIFQNYKAKIQDLSLQSIATLSNIRFHKQKSSASIYAGAGLGIAFWNTKVNALDASGNTYAALFSSVASSFQSASGVYSTRKDLLKTLKDGMDNTYETPADQGALRTAKSGSNLVKPSASILLGIEVKLSKRVNIALEDRQTFVKSDLVDGQQYQAFPYGDAAKSGAYDSWNFLSLGLNVNVGNKTKTVAPLWWLNPLDYAYSELNNPKHMKLPKPVFADTDGDGVTDQLDKEPSTPAGCPVDTHGVTRDTDGDGVPDCKDKQLITPTECQPVDASGVGKCPDPACCNEMKDLISKMSLKPACPVDYPSISMKSTKLSKDAIAMLGSVQSKLKNSPTCTITLTAYPAASKAQQSVADKKLDVIKNYLVEKLGISSDRVSTEKSIGGGDQNTIDIKSN
jgi:hypothetical protein